MSTASRSRRRLGSAPGVGFWAGALCAMLLAWPIAWPMAWPTACSASAALAAFETDEEAVEAGGNALDPMVDYPWYDPSTDDLQPVDLSPAPPPKPPVRWNWPSLSVFEWIAGTVITILLLLLLYLLINAFMNRETTGAVTRDEVGAEDQLSEVDRVEALPFQIKRPKDDLLGEARRQREQGNYNEAIVYLYSHMLLELDRQQRIRLSKWKTNREYLRELSNDAELREMLSSTMVAFEDVFFGNRNLDQARFDACWQRLDRFTHLAQQHLVAA